MEIEKKWLFNSHLDPKNLGGAVVLETYMYGQGYLTIDDHSEVRIRFKIVDGDCTYMLCIKSKGDLSRIEIEKELTEEEFDQLNSLIPYDLIINEGFNYDIGGGHILAICRTDVNREEFVYGEIEFDSVEEAEAFVAPDWFGKEVTKDSSYKMSNYWIRTRINQGGLPCCGGCSTQA